MYAWELPASLEISGNLYKIRTDYRVILDILAAMNDPEIFEPGMTEDEKNQERAFTILQILYEDFEAISPCDYDEALQKACEFIDYGVRDDGKPKPRIMDWEQDAPIIIPAINKAYPGDIRNPESVHWWTFLGRYMEIGESLFAQVISIRQKKVKNKKLEKWEEEFYRENRRLIDLKVNKVQRSEAEKNALRELFGFKKK